MVRHEGQVPSRSKRVKKSLKEKDPRKWPLQGPTAQAVSYGENENGEKANSRLKRGTSKCGESALEEAKRN